MASADEQARGGAASESASEDEAVSARRRGRSAVELPKPYDAVLHDYGAALEATSLSAQTRRTYASKVRQFLAWLAGAEGGGDPLHATDARDRAVREYRTHLQAVLQRKPATVNNALAAVDDFYVRRGMGPARAARADLPRSAPKALSKRAGVRFLRAVEACPSPRDRAIALVPFYAGARIAEITRLDVDDVHLSARTGIMRISGTGGRFREIPIHPQLRGALNGWLDQRAGWPGAGGPALFLNQRGKRLSVRGAHDIITAMARGAGLDGGTTSHMLRHTFATRLVRGGTDLVIVAELLGHARLETTRMYARPTRKDAIKALDLLDVNQ